jgi:hypothetical protein
MAPLGCLFCLLVLCDSVRITSPQSGPGDPFHYCLTQALLLDTRPAFGVAVFVNTSALASQLAELPYKQIRRIAAAYPI